MLFVFLGINYPFYVQIVKKKICELQISYKEFQGFQDRKGVSGKVL